ncbi:MAG: response regulator [Candidatus Marinimicrobia bacterium]|nr:response regulator [Candidatus Neomarinimicrobiota bacterium]
MNKRVLFVDDDENVLNGYKRFYKRMYDIVTTAKPADAIRIVKNTGEDFAVVVSDMNMPEINGIELLTEVKKLAPDTVRIMLTGNAELNLAIMAVNQGNIFRFLTKPCAQENFVKAIDDAIELHRLIKSEQELLEKTLYESVKVLTDLLGIVNPKVFFRINRLLTIVDAFLQNYYFPEKWQLRIATMLSLIGCITVPEEVVERVYSNDKVASEELEMYETHPEIAYNLLKKIPRMDKIATIIKNQNKLYSEYKEEDENSSGYYVHLGSQILKVLLDYEKLLDKGVSCRCAVAMMAKKIGHYNVSLLESMKNIKFLDNGLKKIHKQINISELQVGMILDADVMSKNGNLLAPRNLEINDHMLQRLKNFSKRIGVNEPFDVVLYERNEKK